MRRAAVLRLFLAVLIGSLALATWAQVPANNKKLDARINQLLLRMTLDEKIGQLNQYSFDQSTIEADIAAGRVGSVISESDAARVQQLQRIAIEKSRLHIPILFGHDVIHGFRTIFPIPLGLASSWDPAVIERMARISANEASASGIRWTFSPMVDIARDPRWGRISEGAGEDTYLQSELAAAYVRGYQGKNLSDPTSIAACVKHFVGYGAAEAGRDYNSVDMSERKLREVYLPPFRAAIEAGAPTVMTSFNTLNGVPATANPFILRQVLRKEWGFSGLVVSDFNAIAELIPHGVADTKESAGLSAFKSGVDMDMNSKIYLDDLAQLVRSGRVSQSLIDESVRRVLRLKFDLGLFEHPYSEITPEQAKLLTAENRKAARDIADRSMVLLKNNAKVLPLNDSIKTIAVIGPLADSKADMLGNWFGAGEADQVVTPLEAIRNRLGPERVLFSKGGEVTQSSDQEIADAVATAQKGDAIVMFLGEKGTMSGEAASRAELGLPGDQQKLLEAVVAAGKPVALIVMSGRPLAISWAADHVPAILQAWFPGTEAGNAVADVLFGDFNPSGKLPVTFPRSVGQVPIYYNSLNTGRPLMSESEKKYRSAYLDSSNAPLYPFGFGLSFTRFQYSDLEVEAPEPGGAVHAKVRVQNVGDRSGDEVVQVYSRGLLGSISRPVKELKAFQRVSLAPGESRTVEFTIQRNQLSFLDADAHRTVEPGKYLLSVGSNSDTTLQASFSLSTTPGNLGSRTAKRNLKSPAVVNKKKPASASTGAAAVGSAF